jgi:heme/copper-type cytochrome/quinol oxidase subunit 1
MIAPLSLFLIVLPPALAVWRGMRVVWIMAAGVAGLALFGIVLWMTLAGVWPFARQEDVQDTYYVVAHWRYVMPLCLLVAVLAAAQAVKARRGEEARQTTLALFALLIGGMALMLAPLTFGRVGGMTSGLTTAVSWVAEVGGVLALGGLIGLIWVILLAPVLRWMRGRG